MLLQYSPFFISSYAEICLPTFFTLNLSIQGNLTLFSPFIIVKIDRFTFDADYFEHFRFTDVNLIGQSQLDLWINNFKLIWKLIGVN